jgi:hypothetical protein
MGMVKPKKPIGTVDIKKLDDNHYIVRVYGKGRVGHKNNLPDRCFSLDDCGNTP